eukprot:CAMPEP_0119412598 /NCGR_PEP_ID=MMETSP1335-20130426/4985_1 /TAXON_ID=259385 /ORGANISM="Chrysoculter rhomboideus, Strain RCC1486" /LENGTH=43 /DNA_ID= /DNA_START= /DNA_END= /DNA_ORIENTATION=
MARSVDQATCARRTHVELVLISVSAGRDKARDASPGAPKVYFP